MNEFKLKAEVVFESTLKQIRLDGYKDAPVLPNEVLYVMAKQASIHVVNQLINEHTLKHPSRSNIERHNYWVKVLNQLKENF